jgi:hypothetical protein
VLFPPQLGIKAHTKIFSCVGIWNFCAIHEDWLLFNLVVVKSIYTDLDSLADMNTRKNRVMFDEYSYESVLSIALPLLDNYVKTFRRQRKIAQA